MWPLTLTQKFLSDDSEWKDVKRKIQHTTQANKEGDLESRVYLIYLAK